MMNYKKIAASVAAVMVMSSVAACTSKTANETSAPAETVATLNTTEPTYTSPAPDYSSMSINTVYGSQLPQYLNHQYTFNGQPVDINVSNYFFIEAFGDMCNMASYYGMSFTNEGFVDLSVQMYEDPSAAEPGYENATWGDYFVEFAESSLQSSLIFNLGAQQNNVQLTAEQLAEIDSIFGNIEEQATEAGLTLDEFLQIYFGETATEESMREVITMDYLKYQYMEFYADNYEFDEEEITVPNVRYVLFYAPNDGSLTEEEMNAQLALAQEVYDNSEDAGLLQVEGALAYANGEAYEYGDEFPVEAGKVVPEFEAWAYDEARVENEVGLIQTEMYGYFVVGYLGTTEIPDSSKDQIAMAALGDEVADIVENNTYGFGTTDVYEPAAPVAAPQDSMDAVQQAITDNIAPSAEAAEDSESDEGMPLWAILLIAAGATGLLGVVVGLATKKGGKSKETPKNIEE